MSGASIHSDKALPYAFVFTCGNGSSDDGESIDEAFLSALRTVDPDGLTITRVYRGGVLIRQLAYKPTAISAKPAKHDKIGGNIYSQARTTQRADMGLYALLVGDFVETCLAQWNTFDRHLFWKQVANQSLDATIVPSLSPALAVAVDKVLRNHVRYIGAVEPDWGNPLHRNLFLESMYKDAFIRGGRVFVQADDETEYNGMFIGADTFSPESLAVLSYEKFESSAPEPCLQDNLSARGLVTKMRMRKRMAPNIHQKVLVALASDQSLRNAPAPFDWDLTQLPDAPEEVEVHARKLTDYLLDPSHKKGESKAHFFNKTLGITRKDWAYVHAQLVDGLSQVKYENVRLDNYGIRFTAYLAVLGRNGVTATIETGWIVRSGERASFVTAFPASKNDALEKIASEPSIVCSGLTGDVRWQMIYELAEEAGRLAMEACVPTPLVVESKVYMDGDCGGAFIVIADARKSFSRWLKKKGLGNRYHRPGYTITAPQIRQSAETARAYADAFTRVLCRNGIDCRTEFYLT